GNAAAQSPVRPSLIQAFSGNVEQRVFLTVGWINPRKNHGALLDAFEQLWREGSQARLVVVGKIDVTSLVMARRIKAQPECVRRLLGFDDLSDAVLEYFYDQDAVLWNPSFMD